MENTVYCCHKCGKIFFARSGYAPTCEECNISTTSTGIDESWWNQMKEEDKREVIEKYTKESFYDTAGNVVKKETITVTRGIFSSECKGWLELAGSVIGVFAVLAAFYVAYVLGVDYSHYSDRDWVKTIIIFAATAFSGLIPTLILFSFAEVLKALEKISANTAPDEINKI